MTAAQRGGAAALSPDRSRAPHVFGGIFPVELLRTLCCEGWRFGGQLLKN
jgi:hypothetical protein